MKTVLDIFFQLGHPVILEPPPPFFKPKVSIIFLLQRKALWCAISLTGRRCVCSRMWKEEGQPSLFLIENTLPAPFEVFHLPRDHKGAMHARIFQHHAERCLQGGGFVLSRSFAGVLSPEML